MDGDAIYKIVIAINEPTAPPEAMPIPDSTIVDCCNDLTLKVFAESGTYTSDYKNDKSSVLWKFNPASNTAQMTLKQFISGSWQVVDTLNTNTYGTFYDFGFYVNGYNEPYIGYQIDWYKVMDNYGAGSFKVAVTGDIVFGGSETNESPVYCLSLYNDELANGTVRIEWYNNKLIGDPNDDTKFFDYGDLNWFNSVRLRGFFGYPKSNYEREKVQYTNGARRWIADTQEPEYKLKLLLIPYYLHGLLRCDMMQADEILITDYNNNNAEVWQRKNVYPVSGYEPQWYELQSKLASVEIKFNQTYNRLIKRRS